MLGALPEVYYWRGCCWLRALDGRSFSEYRPANPQGSRSLSAVDPLQPQSPWGGPGESPGLWLPAAAPRAALRHWRHPSGCRQPRRLLLDVALCPVSSSLLHPDLEGSVGAPPTGGPSTGGQRPRADVKAFEVPERLEPWWINAEFCPRFRKPPAGEAGVVVPGEHSGPTAEGRCFFIPRCTSVRRCLAGGPPPRSSVRKSWRAQVSPHWWWGRSPARF